MDNKLSEDEMMSLSTLNKLNDWKSNKEYEKWIEGEYYQNPELRTAFTDKTKEIWNVLKKRLSQSVIRKRPYRTR